MLKEEYAKDIKSITMQGFTYTNIIKVHLSDYLILKKKEENIVLSYVFIDEAREKFCVNHPLCNLLINKSITMRKTNFVHLKLSFECNILNL